MGRTKKKRSQQGKKRSRNEFEANSPQASMQEGAKGKEDADSGEWQVVERKSKRSKTHGYPAIVHTPSIRLNATTYLTELQTLVLYILSDGVAPKFVAVREPKSIKKVVVLMVPGLDMGLFKGHIALEAEVQAAGADVRSPEPQKQDMCLTSSKQDHVSKLPEGVGTPDAFYPRRLDNSKLQRPLQPLSNIFNHVWPLRTNADERTGKMYSSMNNFLSCTIHRSKEEKTQQGPGPKPPASAASWKDQPTPVSRFIADVGSLVEDRHVLHPSLFKTEEEKAADIRRRQINRQDAEHGWVDSTIDGAPDVSQPAKDDQTNLTGGWHVLALDCEMCKTEGDVYELTKVTVMDWDGVVVLEELVKPEKPVIDYVTRFSGVTREMLDPVDTRLTDIQQRLLKMFSSKTILVGHSLDSDLNALKMTHPHLVDTSLLYPHPRGPPYKHKLKWLTEKFLQRSIQTGSDGHDPKEDARAALDLVKLKCQRGPKWGTSDASQESLFQRLSRSKRPCHVDGDNCIGACVNWGPANRGYEAHAHTKIGCDNDSDVVQGVARCVNGDPDGKEVPGGGVDFVWARMRELEAHRGHWDSSHHPDVEKLRLKCLENSKAPTQDNSTEGLTNLGVHVGQTVERIQAIYDDLPRCTAFMVYSGHGDVRELERLQKLKTQYKREYDTKKWNDISISWTEKEEAQMKNEVKSARLGVGFMTVK
ncbi:MAG: hypothetical protein M1831_000700 [Alyxoria varia]|nr:MAG: hypothetical protein M1831_000700 [Alyxoria varia]